MSFMRVGLRLMRGMGKVRAIGVPGRFWAMAVVMVMVEVQAMVEGLRLSHWLLLLVISAFTPPPLLLSASP